mmetsp:Transcript_19788/g.51516  ORF Transcript_19788/g.51516 Transcript_19788/m.51516 type:complete len:237 (+) Transcript_19788:661-1371(+)
MLPLGARWWSESQEQSDRGETIATLWMISRSGLMHAGNLPTDPKTLAYETNPVALEAHAYGEPSVRAYQASHLRQSQLAPTTRCAPLTRDGPGRRPLTTALARIPPQGDCRCASSVAIPWRRPQPHAADGKLGPGCTLDPDAFPACVAKWASTVTPPGPKSPWVAVAVINMGENSTDAAVSVDGLALNPAGAPYTLSDVWTGAVVGRLSRDGALHFPVRPHASRFFKAVGASGVSA